MTLKDTALTWGINLDLHKRKPVCNLQSDTYTMLSFGYSCDGILLVSLYLLTKYWRKSTGKGEVFILVRSFVSRKLYFTLTCVYVHSCVGLWMRA